MAKSVWQTEDGSTFDDLTDANLHEMGIRLREVIHEATYLESYKTDKIVPAIMANFHLTVIPATGEIHEDA